MKRLILILAAATYAFGQNPPPPTPAPLAPGEQIRVVELKQASANSVYQSLKTIFPGVSTSGERRLVIRGPVAVVDMIEEAIKKLDSPSPESAPAPNVELTIQLLQGSAQDGVGGPIPVDLEATVRQLRGLFPYKSYKTLDTQLLRVRSGGYGDLSGTMPGGTQTFFFLAQPTVNPGPAPRTIRLAPLRLEFRKSIVVDGKTQNESRGITTPIDVREGQKTVVGKSNIAGSDDAIILVVTPKVIE